MKEIDCLGEICPIPVLKTLEALKHLESGACIKVISDHSCVVESIQNHIENKNIIYTCDEVIFGVWEITITKQV